MPKKEEVAQEFRCGMVAIVGEVNVGKSTLLNQILGTKVTIVSPRPQTTRNRIIGIKNSENSQIVFIDTPGFLKSSQKGELEQLLAKEARDGMSDVDLNLFVIDGEQAIRKVEYIAQLEKLFRSRKFRKPELVAINKIDLVDRLHLLPLMARLQKIFHAKRPTELVPISAKSGDGVELLVERISTLLPLGPNLFPRDAVTDQSEDFLVSEIIREKLFCHLHQELPYSVAVRIEGWEEDERGLRVSAQILVERNSQKAIVIGKEGSMLKAVGRSARLELEKILGTHVYLELFVRVEENWTRTRQGLRKVGYQ